MILSASGWRDIFAYDGEAESRSTRISGFHKFFSAASASVFVDFIRKKTQNGLIRIIVGLDTRPTGMSIAKNIIRTILAKDAHAIFCGVTAAPEIMAYARALGGKGAADGFIYISASHNPIGYNGIKFGLTDGGVLGGADMAQLAAGFYALRESQNASSLLLESLNSVKSSVLNKALSEAPRFKQEALAAYMEFSNITAAGGQEFVLTELKNTINITPLGIAADFNGSARTLSIDKVFFENFGLKFAAINAKAGEIVHRIVPEGDSLIPCLDFLSELRQDNPDFILAYTPDCDGDRGNIVFFDENANFVRPLEAQEVFALACLSELCQLVWLGGAHLDEKGSLRKTAVAVNDATSMRIDRIANAFGAVVFRAETGEANVVNLGRRLRAEGWTTPVMGEGAAGGSIIHPSSVRDPLQTVTALLKLLRIRSRSGKKGFFEIWQERCGLKKPYSNDFNLSDVIASLPAFITTSAYSADAGLQIVSGDHARLKERYQNIFLREWHEKESRLHSEWGICAWEAFSYNGSEERRDVDHFGDSGRGGLRICFYNESGSQCASIWMRGSGTEPVFRVMADVDAGNSALERALLSWHRGMVLEADKERD
ncbi:MAG: phosphatidylglycerol lysyltransferase [Spirochaetaceae bacterium]|jgi:phosphoglucomutase|nr:phosphatidylglycerol lysyltransferase [Spirochaetaceae bacterium]